MKIAMVALLAGGLASAAAPARADGFDELCREFWAWAAANRPLASYNNDLPRIERDPQWVPDWSAAAIAKRRQEIADFERRWRAIDASAWPVPRQVDHRLVGAEIARVKWEFEMVKGWERNAIFYVDHTIGAIRDRLLQPPPIGPQRAGEILRRMERIPLIVEQAKANLADARAPLARWAIEDTKDMRTRLATVVRELKPLLPPDVAGQIDAPTEKAIAALESYNAWLTERLPRMNPSVAIGRDAYLYYLWNIALFPFTPEEMLAMAEQYQDQVLTWEAVELSRNAGLPPLKGAPDVKTLVEKADWQQRALRQFLNEKILTVPDWVGHYRLAPTPEYLKPIQGGSLDDLTSPSRTKEDAVYYIGSPTPPSDTYLDPRTNFSHTGIPGHFFQQSLGWAHEDPVRRRFYDNLPNEGIAFYVAELLLRLGLLDENPRLREVTFRQLKERPLRVQFDVNLQLGNWTFEQANAHYPANRAIVADPTLTISNLMGLMQLHKLMAAARRVQGDKFDLRAFHDYVWKNGNVPHSLMRWELLGLRDQVDRLEQLRASQVSAPARPGKKPPAR